MSLVVAQGLTNKLLITQGYGVVPTAAVVAPWTTGGIAPYTRRMLDPRKRALMVSTRAEMRADRATTLVGVIASAAQGVQYVVLSGCVVREHMNADQTIALTQGTAQIDAILELPLLDPLTGAVNNPFVVTYLARTSTPTAGAVAAAPKYEIVSAKKGGMIDNRWIAQLRRLR